MKGKETSLKERKGRARAHQREFRKNQVIADAIQHNPVGEVFPDFGIDFACVCGKVHLWPWGFEEPFLTHPERLPPSLQARKD